MLASVQSTVLHRTKEDLGTMCAEVSKDLCTESDDKMSDFSSEEDKGQVRGDLLKQTQQIWQPSLRGYHHAAMVGGCADRQTTTDEIIHFIGLTYIKDRQQVDHLIFVLSYSTRASRKHTRKCSLQCFERSFIATCVDYHLQQHRHAFRWRRCFEHERRAATLLSAQSHISSAFNARVVKVEEFISWTQFKASHQRFKSVKDKRTCRLKFILKPHLRVDWARNCGM